MHSATLLAALAGLVPFVDAHGRVNSVTGDAGGNGTALGIMGGVVPDTGPNKVTEVDTTVFKSTKAASNGLGKTQGGGKNDVADMVRVMAMSGSTLPQVSSNGGSIKGEWQTVTTDGAGPLNAMIDPTGTGQFAEGTKSQVTTDIPGNNGNIKPGPKASNKRISRLMARAGLVKRAKNVNEKSPFEIAVPAGTTCTGSMGGLQGVCLMRIANSNPAGPFGGVIAFQMAGSNGKPPAGTAPAGTNTNGSGAGAA